MTKAKKTDLEDDAQGDVGAELKPWQKPDYNGPLTLPQAAWRNAHIKPVDEDTKPSGEVVTK